MYCKVCTKAKGLREESQGRNIKIMHSVDMLVFKNTNWPTCVHMIKYNKNIGDIFLINKNNKTMNFICMAIRSSYSIAKAFKQ